MVIGTPVVRFDSVSSPTPRTSKWYSWLFVLWFYYVDNKLNCFNHGLAFLYMAHPSPVYPQYIQSIEHWLLVLYDFVLHLQM